LVGSAGYSNGSDEVHRGNGDEGAAWSINPNPDAVSMYVDTGSINNNNFEETQGHLGDVEGAKIAAGCLFYQDTASYSAGPHAGLDCTKMSGATHNASNDNAWAWNEVLPNKFLQGWVAAGTDFGFFY